MRPLVKLWHGQGIRCVMYIDDRLIILSGLQKAKQDSTFVRDSLESPGLVANAAKSHWEPKQSGQGVRFSAKH